MLQGPVTPPLLHQTIPDNFKATVGRRGDHPALVSCHQDARFTYADLDRLVDQTANGLLQLGLQPGDRLGLWAQNCWEWCVLPHNPEHHSKQTHDVIVFVQ